MTKKHFIELADAIREHNSHIDQVFGVHGDRMRFSAESIDVIANFCASQNSRFNRERWLDYIAGECGPACESVGVVPGGAGGARGARSTRTRHA